MASHPGGVFKREGNARITQVESHWLRSTPDPETACRGDSGGPALLEVDGQEVLVGIASLGAEGCDGDIQHVRVDAIIDFIRALPESSVAPGPELIVEAAAVRPSSPQAPAGCSAQQARSGVSSVQLALLALPLLLLLRRRRPAADVY
jgi:secreted trypsin-like serine protease